MVMAMVGQGAVVVVYAVDAVARQEEVVASVARAEEAVSAVAVGAMCTCCSSCSHRTSYVLTFGL